jgi:hypothetical protein
MIIELLVLQLTLEGIKKEYENIRRSEGEKQHVELVKRQLGRVLQDYQSGKISSRQYQKLENEILSSAKMAPRRTRKAKS